MAERIGFIGVGRMGGHMARRLLAAGYDLIVSDPDQGALEALTAAGASAAPTPAAVAAEASIVMASLPTPATVETVALGPDGIMAGGICETFIDLSTTGSVTATRVARALAEHSIVAVDAPVSGGVAGAEQGTLAIMVSCPDATFATVEPVLKHLGRVFQVGTEPGQGQTMKLINNLLSGTAMAISSEAMVMGVKAGLDPRLMIDVINAGSGRNTATMDKIPRCVIPRTFDFGFALSLLNKDIRLCLDEAASLGVPMVVGSAVRQLLTIAAARAGSDADMTEIVKCVEEWAAVEVGAVGR
jgi:3-hydroxyisobutyrate dehydrogenase-like beta-hydroxyacid dehydrogenase